MPYRRLSPNPDQASRLLRTNRHKMLKFPILSNTNIVKTQQNWHCACWFSKEKPLVVALNYLLI
jgi:hypothetical protein